MMTRNASEPMASKGETLKLTTTITVFEIRLPITGKKPRDEGHHHHSLREREMDAQPGHEREQIDARQSGIQCRNPHLREHHVAKGCPKQAGPVGQRLYQWAWLDVPGLAAHRDHAA